MIRLAAAVTAFSTTPSSGWTTSGSTSLSIVRRPPPFGDYDRLRCLYGRSHTRPAARGADAARAARRADKAAARDAAWELGFAAFGEFVAREGHCNLPYKHCEARSGVPVWKWVHDQRVAREKGTMPAARAARLGALDARWYESTEEAAADEREWERLCGLLAFYADAEGHANPRKEETMLGGHVPIGLWLHRQRVARGKGALDDAKAARLEDLGVSWELIDWPTGVALLARFAAREGHAEVPLKHKEDRLPLGRWLKRQRRAREAGALDDARAAQLVECGAQLERPENSDQ